MNEPGAKSLLQVEEGLLSSIINGKKKGAAPGVFILGSPRTGSTVLYQAAATSFGLPYFSNLTNDHFFETPVLGLAIQRGLQGDTRIDFSSRFGKTTGILQPSEASMIMRTWFGGGHPSQIVSSEILTGREEHLRSTFSAAYRLFGKPLLVKNAWNCFRVPTLAKLLPEASFIWIRRDIAAAAKSDLHARYATKGSPTAWNSATPHNVESLQARPHWEQVVENQYEFNVAIGRDLQSHANGRFIEVWYEEFCHDPSRVLDRIAVVCGGLERRASLNSRVHELKGSGARWELPGNDAARVDAYVEVNQHRFGTMRWTEGQKSGGVTASSSQPGPNWRLQRITQESLRDYLQKDQIAAWLRENSQPGDDALTAQRWLVESPAKRHIVNELYGDLLQSTGRSILDVGGGLTAFTRMLAARHRYELVELLAHESQSVPDGAHLGGTVLHHCDWLDFQIGADYDVVIANDLLPNVDQRLELFLGKFLPRCRELRMSLTFCDPGRYYRTRRVDGDEIFFMLAWTWEQLRSVIERVGGPQLSIQLDTAGFPTGSIFPNGRHVVLLTVRGPK